MSDTAALGSIISQYRLEVGEYPENLSNLTKAKGQYGPWIHAIPQDVLSKGKSYSYQHSDNKFMVFSVGANGAPESSLSAGISGDDVGFIGK